MKKNEIKEHQFQKIFINLEEKKSKILVKK